MRLIDRLAVLQNLVIVKAIDRENSLKQCAISDLPQLLRLLQINDLGLYKFLFFFYHFVGINWFLSRN
jgi:hypothetical protein